MFTAMRYVYEVYKEKSFSRAAENFYISQPALSSMVKKVEAKVGAPLFNRNVNPIQLTECGEEYIRTAEKIMGLEEDFAHYVGNLNDLKTGSLSLGGTFMFTSLVFPPLVREFSRRYPDVRINMFEGHTSLLEEKLFNGDLDLIIDNTKLDDKTCEKIIFSEERMLLAVPASFASNDRVRDCQLTAEDVAGGRHLEADFPGVPLKAFQDDPFIVLKSHNDSRARADAILQNAGFRPRYYLKLNQLLTTYYLSAADMGIAFTTDVIVRRLPDNGRLIFYKLDDPVAARHIYLYYKKNKYLTRSMLEFIRIAAPDFPVGP